MRILHVVESLAPRYGGPSVACPAMCRELARRGHQVAIYATDVDGSTRLSVPLDHAMDDGGVHIHYFRGWTFPPRYKFSWPLARALRDTLPAFDVAHIYSLYGFPTAAASYYCRKYRVPYLLHPHGSLDPFLRQHHRRRKQLYTELFLRPVFRDATVVLFNSAEERRLARGAPELVRLDDPAGHGPPSAVVDVGVEDEFFRALPPEAGQQFREKFPELKGRRLVTFLGRLNFKKGLDILVAAFAAVAAQHGDIHLVLAGPDGDSYSEKICGWLRDAGMLARATFTGHIAGVERVALLRESAVVALPSYTENFGQAVAEAMAAGVAVVISDRVNIWPEVERARAGLVVRCDVAETAQALRTLLADPALAREIGRRGRQMAAERLTWAAVGNRILEVYEQMLERSRERQGLVEAGRAATA